jgi:DinB superfamily
MSSPEPWLRGPLEGVHPLVMPVFFSFAQVREDLKTHLDGLSEAKVWRQFGKASIGFHLKHLAGSVDRLTTYLRGEPLSSEQLRTLREEGLADASLPELLRRVDASLRQSENYLKTIDPATLYDARQVGRQALPTTVIGLIVHLAEHTQRHLGQAITLSRVVRQTL